MPIYEIMYDVKATRIATVKANSPEEAEKKWHNDEFINDYENDSYHTIDSIEEIAE